MRQKTRESASQLFGKFSRQPRLGETQIAPDGIYRDLKCIRYLLRAQAREMAKLDRLALTGFNCGQRVECPMQIEKLTGRTPWPHDRLIARMRDQNLPCVLGGLFGKFAARETHWLVVAASRSQPAYLGKSKWNGNTHN